MGWEWDTYLTGIPQCIIHLIIHQTIFIAIPYRIHRVVLSDIVGTRIPHGNSYQMNGRIIMILLLLLVVVFNNFIGQCGYVDPGIGFTSNIKGIVPKFRKFRLKEINNCGPRCRCGICIRIPTELSGSFLCTAIGISDTNRTF